MSFWKQFFICCDSTASHSDLLLNETKKKHSLKNQSTNHSHSPSKSPHLSDRITIRSIKKEDKNSSIDRTFIKFGYKGNYNYTIRPRFSPFLTAAFSHFSHK